MEQVKTSNNSMTDIDVLIICALKDEYDEVVQVTDGIRSDGWAEHTLPSGGYTVADSRFITSNGTYLCVRATWTSHMGRENVQGYVSNLIKENSVRCLAMTGICAGRREKVALGDVIFADRMWSYDTGKLTVEDGNQVFQGDMHQYGPTMEWIQRIQSTDFSPLADGSWQQKRPLFTLEQQEDWVLTSLVEKKEPQNRPDFRDRCPDWTNVIRRLWKKKYLKNNSLILTASGRKQANQLKLLHPDGLPSPPGFKVHVAPIATGAAVVEDENIFSRLSYAMRKVLGIDMEASGLSALGKAHGIPVIVAKGVSDYGDPYKDDRYRHVAARAAAESLILLFRNASDLLRVQSSITHSYSRGISSWLQMPHYEWSLARSSPGALLRADYNVVPFHGRVSEVEELNTWAEKDDRSLAIRLYTGAGGMGKTRLSLEFCKRLIGQNWLAGFVKGPDIESGIDFNQDLMPLLQRNYKVALIIDYAEMLRPLIEKLLLTVQTNKQSKLRIILLSRAAGDWWYYLKQTGGGVGELLSSACTERVRLQPLALSINDRQHSYSLALEVFSEKLQRQPTQVDVIDFSQDYFERALLLHMTALAALEGEHIQGEDGILSWVLNRERRFWREMLASHSVASTLFKGIGQLMAAYTLGGGAKNREEAVYILRGLSFFNDQTKDVQEAIVSILHQIYPGDRWIEPLQPDLLGEHLVATELTDESVQSEIYEMLFNS